MPLKGICYGCRQRLCFFCRSRGLLLRGLQVVVGMNTVHYFVHFLFRGFVVHKGDGFDKSVQLFEIAATVPTEQQVNLQGDTCGNTQIAIQ
jgi:hypothetical protein|tara:strand:- start:120 stop:392 length:273 start_codon:yes stop_codon:yes gene_type:complete